MLLCPSPENPGHATSLAHRLEEALNRPLALSAGMVDLHASIGLAFNEPGDTCDALVARADAAMYQSKRGGGGTAVLYSHAADDDRSASTVVRGRAR